VFLFVQVDLAALDAEDAEIDGSPDDANLRQDRAPKIVVEWIVMGKATDVFSRNSPLPPT
jgi:hypothetical protein